MVLKKGPVLTESEKTQIYELMQTCRQSGDDGADYPVDDDDCCHYLLWDGDDARSLGCLCGVLGIFFLSDESAECIAYVRPEKRRQGLFSQMMLPEALDDFSGLEFVFPVRGNGKGSTDAGILAVLNSIGADYERTEYRMDLTLNRSSDNGATYDEMADLSDIYGAVSYSHVANDNSFTFIYPPDAGSVDASVSHCHVEKVSADAVCLTNVETNPGMRNLGYGTAMILALADELKNRGIRKITVHVGGDNLPALSLYEKTGFRTTETLSYYIF